jgi:hypothetical protein
MIKVKVQLNNFAYEYDLPMIFSKGDSDNYFIMMIILQEDYLILIID